MKVNSNFHKRSGDSPLLVSSIVNVTAEMRLFDRLPRSLQLALRNAPIDMQAVHAFYSFLEKGEPATLEDIVYTGMLAAPRYRPIRAATPRRRRRQIPEAVAYSVAGAHRVRRP